MSLVKKVFQLMKISILLNQLLNQKGRHSWLITVKNAEKELKLNFCNAYYVINQIYASNVANHTIIKLNN